MKTIALIGAAVVLAGCGSKTILVQGDGAITVSPDLVTISAQASATEDTVVAATVESNRTMRSILDGLGKMELGDAQITTTSFSVRPNCRYEGEERKYVCKGYTASNGVNVQLSDLALVGEVLSKLGEFGADVIQPPDYSFKDLDKVQEEARASAIENAEHQAQQYASATGWTLGRVIGVESTIAVGSNYSRYRYVNDFRRGPIAAMQMVLDAPSGVPVIVSEQTVTDSVVVEFELQGSLNPFAAQTWF